MKKYLLQSIVIILAVGLAAFSAPRTLSAITPMADSGQPNYNFLFTGSTLGPSAVENPSAWVKDNFNTCPSNCGQACRLLNIPSPLYHWDSSRNNYILNSAAYIASGPTGIDGGDIEMVIPAQAGCIPAKYKVVFNNGTKILTAGTIVNKL